MNTKTILKHVQSNGGVTLNKRGKIVSFDSGYQVSFEAGSLILKYPLPLDRFDYVLETKLQYIKRIDYLGVWLNDNKIYFDVSEHIDDLTDAIEVAKQRNQLAIYNWKLQNSLYL
jgi:hypothetical protein